MKNKKWILVYILAGAAAGYFIRGGGDASHSSMTMTGTEAELNATMYTCSMHPQIRQSGPGKCPICAMDLIPVVQESNAGLGPRELKMSPAAQKLAQVETAEIVRDVAARIIPLSGTVAYDTTQTRDVTMLSDGQIRKLYANYTGIRIRSGDPLAEIYSPDVFSASRELVIAGQSQSETMKTAARQKLRLLGVSDSEIEKISQSGKASDTYAVISPYDGVLDSPAWHEGQWLMRGDDLAVIVDNARVWVELDAYEHDAGLIKEGQAAEFTVEAVPGNVFSGVVTFVSPEMNMETRVLRVRMEADNPNELLKRGMFVRAKLKAPIPGNQLLIPASAPLITGKRAVVYVESPDKPGVFEGREIQLGPRVGDEYVVTSGLKEGERVAVKGAMRIDSTLQIQAKPSMMSEGGGMPPGHQHGPASAKPVEMRPQTKCPVEGGEIKKDEFADYNGMRIYFCCPGCDEEFLSDPEKFISEMRAKGIEPERIDGENQNELTH